MFFAEKFSQSQCSICPVGSHCHNTRSRRCEGSTRICSFQRQFEIRNFQRQVQICNFQRWVQICNFQRWFKIRNFQKWPFKDKQGEHTYFFSAASSFFFFSLPLSFLDTFSLFFLELMALAVVALVPALFFGATADTLEVPVAAVGTGTGASLLMLPLLLSPWWCSCTVACPLHLCCQKSWILVWRQLLWLFGSLCVKTWWSLSSSSSSSKLGRLSCGGKSHHFGVGAVHWHGAQHWACPDCNSHPKCFIAVTASQALTLWTPRCYLHPRLISVWGCFSFSFLWNQGCNSSWLLD